MQLAQQQVDEGGDARAAAGARPGRRFKGRARGRIRAGVRRRATPAQRQQAAHQRLGQWRQPHGGAFGGQGAAVARVQVQKDAARHAVPLRAVRHAGGDPAQVAGAGAPGLTLGFDMDQPAGEHEQQPFLVRVQAQLARLAAAAVGLNAVKTGHWKSQD
ncbi:hypothetical protein [Vandammella animalimorsus]|uniref:hypothetical protein n=1 Tax=Vandammella animalimorsus TaxID=2029117 RepID=UPI000BAA6239|nr:hypothetical protein [Vandammella animalimorsus]PAT31301.1 hypothetical protein CK626_11030 [Vandammella animalimorsus]